MPQIGWFEILIIVAISIIVIGPKDFPFVLKKIGSWIGTVKRYVNNITNEVSNLDQEITNTDKNMEKHIRKINGKIASPYSNIGFIFEMLDVF